MTESCGCGAVSTIKFDQTKVLRAEAAIETIETPDPLTVRLKLKGPSGQIEYWLAANAGMMLSPAALGFSWTREIDLGFARVRAARMSWMAGLLSTWNLLQMVGCRQLGRRQTLHASSTSFSQP